VYVYLSFSCCCYLKALADKVANNQKEMMPVCT